MLPTIKQGKTNNNVKIAQYLTGYAARKEASGIFDANFVAAVCTWQRNHGLTPDGIIGPKTWSALALNAPICSKKKNTTSAETCALQIALGGLDADGVFGNKTKAAVVAFQSAHGLNPDGSCGPITWGLLITGNAAGTVTPTPGKFVQPVDYKQYDSRWGSIKYTSCGNSSQTIKNSGCGPTSAADVVATLKDASITPKEMAALALQWGDRSKSNGTNWSYFQHVQEHYRFSKMIKSTSIATLKACLDAGGYAVCSMGPGYWTKGGHYICAWKYADGYIFCNDPASSSRKKQIEKDFVSQRKRFFCFYK